MTAPPSLTLEPIGILRCAHAEKVDAPRQATVAAGEPGVIELLPGRNFEHALEDLVGWERLWIIFWFHRNEGWRPKVLPPRSEDGRKGVFATRSPHRPNPLGLSVVRLERVEGLKLHVLDVDMLDGTPVLDIKPYVPYSDAFPESKHGWLARANDPRESYDVLIGSRAEEQLAWIEQHVDMPLRARVVETLSLGPQPHPYRRIKPLADGMMQLAVQDWRIVFRVDGRRVHVIELRSGYRAAQLASPAGDATLQLHARFAAQFPVR